MGIALSKKHRVFIESNMCIQFCHLNEKVKTSPLCNHLDKISKYISKLINASIAKQNDECIKVIYLEYIRQESCPQYKEFIETIWHVFSVFSKGGLHDLFLYQQNECWYPKVQLKQEMSPNDISSLDDEIIIFRGCDISEYGTKLYGQSWTTDRMIANQFALQHYVNQELFKRENRTVLQGVIKKTDVYYSNQSSSEKEITVNPEKITKVIKCV